MYFRGILYLILILTLSCGNSATADPEHSYHHPEEWLKSIQNAPNKGQKIYEAFCATCHAKNPEIPIIAPRMGIESDWVPRMSQGRDKMLKAVIDGEGAMPPRGGCFECSDKDLEEAMAYILPRTSNEKH